MRSPRRRYISRSTRGAGSTSHSYSSHISNTQCLSTAQPFSPSVVRGISDTSPPLGSSVRSPGLAVWGELTSPLLGHGATVVFLLRNTKVFDDDAVIKPYVDSGKAILVKGDALSGDDVASAWKKAAEVNGRVDYVIFSVGM